MTNRVWCWGTGVAMVRVGVLWFLVYHVWTNQQSLTTLPLLLLLFPEAMLLPGSVVWTTHLAMLFSAVLVAGSFLWVLILSFVTRRIGRSPM